MSKPEKGKLFRKLLMLSVLCLCLAGFSFGSAGRSAAAFDCCTDCDARYQTCMNACVNDPEPSACYLLCENHEYACRDRCGCDE